MFYCINLEVQLKVAFVESDVSPKVKITVCWIILPIFQLENMEKVDDVCNRMNTESIDKINDKVKLKLNLGRDVLLEQ
jgi:hypothetical protein